MLLLAEADNGRTVDVHPGDRVRVSLAENATNGYQWALESCDEAFIKPVALEPLYTSEALGSGGMVAFVFEAKQVGTGQIILKQWRPWEGESSVNALFFIRLNIQL